MKPDRIRRTLAVRPRAVTERRPTPIPARLFWLVSTLFFVSGATGLAYQVVWFKRFAHVWGSTSLAFAAVGGSFLLGLGLGAWLIGRRADRLAWPLRWYGISELLIGLLALVVPFEIAGLMNASVRLYAAIPGQPVLRFLFQFAITLVVIGPPCVLMGGTLPLLIRQLTARRGAIDQATGWLYAVNTFGAAAGCYLAGFHLLPALGMLWTGNVAAAVNLTIGLAALTAGRPAAKSDARPPAPARGTAPASGPVPAVNARETAHRVVWVAAALSGCGALVLEMTWSRQLTLVLGGSTYAFSATLFVVLVGIAVGSLVFHAWLRRAASRPAVPLVAIGVLVLATLAGKELLPWLSLRLAPDAVRHLRGDALWNGAICVGASLVVELVPAIAMGLLFPLLVHMTRWGADRVGAAIGSVYVWNTAGSIAGAGLTALLLFPSVGTAGAAACAAALYIVVLLVLIPRRGRQAWMRAGAVAAAGAVTVVALAWPLDPRLTNLGFYRYGPPVRIVGETWAGPRWKSAIETQFFREGASANVFVSRVRGTATMLRLNGKVDASTGDDMMTQLGLGYFPRFFVPRAREVLVIGFGSGTTPGASLLFPGSRVTCCEIEPAVVEASDLFAEANHRPRAQAGLTMIYGDGRTTIQGSDRKYDLIISEPSNPWLAGVSNLFTREFFRSAREHLSEGGVLAQWVQTYNFTLGDYLLILRTLRSEFPHCGVVVLTQGSDTVVLASERPLLPEPATLDTLQRIVNAAPAIASDLRTWFGSNDVRRLLVRHYLLGEEQLDGLLRAEGGRTLNTDLHLRLEFDTPLHLFRALPPAELATVALLRAVEPSWIERLALVAGVPRGSPVLHEMLGDYLLDRVANVRVRDLITRPGDLELAIAHFDSALAMGGNRAEAWRGLARGWQLQGRRDDAIAALEQAVRLEPGVPATRSVLAQGLFFVGRHAEAVPHYREALRLNGRVSFVDGSYMWANDLAWMLATSRNAAIRNGAEALEWAERACAADGRDNPATLDTYAAALAEAGRFDEAIRVSNRILDLVRDDPPTLAEIKAQLRSYERKLPVREGRDSVIH